MSLYTEMLSPADFDMLFQGGATRRQGYSQRFAAPSDPLPAPATLPAKRRRVPARHR